MTDRTIKLTVRARRCVVVAAGSLHTPCVLLRSGFKNKNIGRHLHLHPVTLRTLALTLARTLYRVRSIALALTLSLALSLSLSLSLSLLRTLALARSLARSQALACSDARSPLLFFLLLFVCLNLPSL